MSTIKKNIHLINACALTLLCSFLFSFAPMPGGDLFEISVNDKKLIQHYVHFDKTIKTLDLTEYANETLSIYYGECGAVGSDRSISVRDGDKVLKAWNFDDVDKSVKRPLMTCRVKEILAVQKANAGSSLKLVYASKEHSKGQVMVNLGGGDVKASLK